MTLRELFPQAEPAPPAVPVRALALDHRRVGAGTVFCCVRGFTRDGHDFAADAVAAGAAALLVQRPLGLGVPEVRVDDVRAAMAPAAARLHGDPTARLHVLGITGTSGKTSTTVLLRHVLEAAGTQTGLVGTAGQVVGGTSLPPGRTTPEAIDLQAVFAAMLDGGDTACAMEVSSHALELGRADAVHWRAAAFTNLSQDHLDFHPDMDAYFAAKRRLFEAGPALKVVDVDDAWGRRLADEHPEAVTVALDAPDAGIRATDLRGDASGTSFRVDGVQMRVPVPAPHNVRNALIVLAIARDLGLDDETVAAALAASPRVPGRLEPVDAGQPFAVLVDYAHKPGALEAVLDAGRALVGPGGRLVCVVGCGGDRDRAKRPVMGEIGARLADELVITSDNPRSEDPEAIVDAVLAGARGATSARATVLREVDRRAAVDGAISRAGEGDVVLVAGKGDEQGQTFADGTVPFDDRTVCREALAARGYVGRIAGAPEARS